MNLNFLPENLGQAIKNLNINFLSEIRIRKGHAVIIEYKGEYKYINQFGATDKANYAIVADDPEKILSDAMCGSVYTYTEQLKKGFITADGGIRIGVAGEYISENGCVTAVRGITSLNIRLPHDVENCSAAIYETLFKNNVYSTLIFSPPGYGKTTVLRDLARKIGNINKLNVLVFDERNEIYAADGDSAGFDLGDRVDVVRGFEKLCSFENAIRAMKPQVIITDELYGERDIKAVKFAVDCGIKVIASSHTVEREKLRETPFTYFAELTGIGKPPLIYDKNFNVIADNSTYDFAGISVVGR